MFNKKNLPIIILSSISSIIVVIYLVIGIQAISGLQAKYILLNTVTSIIFLIPFAFSMLFTVKNLKSNKLCSNNKKYLIFLITVSVISFLIFLFYFIYSLKGIRSLTQAIEDIKIGVIYSETYTKEQLLNYENKLLARNIFAFVSNIVLFVNYSYQSIVFFKSKLNNSATSTTIYKDNRESE